MSDYLIWVGEEIEKEHPELSWDMIMHLVTHSNHLPEKWGIEAYLKEVK